MPQPAVPPPLTEKSWHAWVLSFFAWPGVADLTGHDSLALCATKHGINPVEHGKNALPAVVEETSLSRKTSRSIPPTHVEASPSFTKWHTARHTVPAPARRKDGRTDGYTVVILRSLYISSSKISQVESCNTAHSTQPGNPVLSATAARYYIRHTYNLAAAQPRSNQQSIPALSISGAQSSEDNTPRPCPSDINPR